MSRTLAPGSSGVFSILSDRREYKTCETYHEVNALDDLSATSGDVCGLTKLWEFVDVVSKDQIYIARADLLLNQATELVGVDGTEKLGIGVNEGNLGVRVHVFDLPSGF